MSAYAVAHIHSVTMNDRIVRYLQEIDATLAPFEGRFIVHGGSPDILEGQWQGDLIVIAFPDKATAHSWYNSEAYQVICPLRADNSIGDVIIVSGVEAEHRATDILQLES